MDDDMQAKYWENQTEHMHEHSDDDGYSLCYGPAGGPPGGGAGPGGGAAPGASGAQAADRLPLSDSYSSLGFSYL
jgi:hypothetical protein